ncbi:MAG: hypothetical protein EG826_10820 [Deltaproteobacteria bacterium]|nr:hypothetical protein [Deltaproteobacteria bacterium]
MNLFNQGKTFFRLLMIAAFFVLACYTGAWGAVGCDLNDPDRDVARLFPESSGYKTVYTSILKKGGEKLLATVEGRLGDKFRGLFETIDVPYTIYEIFSGKKKIGYIHGVNQKGQYGGIQVFLVLDLQGTIKGFYIQKMTSQYAGKLRDAKFGKQFVGLTVKDFANYDVVSGKATGKVEAIRNPAPEAQVDFLAALRATKKNLILMDEFVYSASSAAPSGEGPKK